ncbi:mechanosensitive ion channel family protein [Rhodanobacter lindaniclasticus]|uniref:Small-conductance mechanosensitive channel n=1 Tax=Rhodanobacter lindaniclasticus TaxID=75310 RepID=A0A4S3KK51_9GAMM|nr:mechanosensitive ion channel domain-containing protein [Rhodanobacter lindaniclasticus]THD09069.1 mechanosensitive ion channel protein MscS [Rhodanobacter lindaniclasticus]
MHDFLEQLLGSTLSEGVIQAGLNLLVALLILLVGIWLAARLANFSQRALQRAAVDVTLAGFLRNLIYGVLVAVLIVMALTKAGVPSAPLVAALGAGGLAIGLALQGSLSNLAWGVLLVVFRPFRVGDYVSAGGTEGTVQSINLMHTLLVLPDNREATLPNAKIGSDVIVNFNRRGTRRFELKLGIGHRDDTDQVMAGIVRLLDADGRALKDPAPGVWIESLAGQTVNLLVRGWTSSADGWITQTDLLRAIKRQIDAGQISIPTAPLDVRLVGDKAVPAPLQDAGDT